PCTLDQCDGTSNDCQHPAGNAGALCHTSSGDLCDQNTFCIAGSTACPSGPGAKIGSVCRGAAGECDLAETCDGASAACPATDAKKPPSLPDALPIYPCTLDQCDGTSNDCQHPAGSGGALCHTSSGGLCDQNTLCVAGSTVCPSG